MADNKSTETLTLTQAQVTEIGREFSMLVSALPAPFVDEIKYSPEFGQDVLKGASIAIQSAEASIIAADKNGTLPGMLASMPVNFRYSPQPLLTAENMTEDDKIGVAANLLVAPMLDAGHSPEAVQQAARDVYRALKDSEANVAALNVLTAQGQEVTIAKQDNGLFGTSIKGAAAPAQTQQQTVQLVPAQEIPADVRERVMRVEQALQKISESVPEANIPAPGKIDGVMDAQSYASYETAMAHFKKETKVGQGTAAGDYTPEIGNQMEDLIKAKLLFDISKLVVPAQFSDAKRTEMENLQAAANMVPGLFADLDYLQSKKALAAVEMKQVVIGGAQVADADVQVNTGVSSAKGGGTPESSAQVNNAPASGGVTPKDPPKPPAPPASSDELAGAITIVETALVKMGDSIGDFKFGGMGVGGLMDGVVDTLDKSDVGGDFDAKSEKLTAQAIMALKTMNGEENPNGVYTPEIGRQLQLAIMTKPEFQMIRTGFEIDQAYSEADAKILLAGFKPSKTIDEFQKLAEGASDADKAARKDAYEKFVNDQYEVFSEAAQPADKLNAFFRSLDVLHKEEQLNAKSAREVTQRNLMLDAASNAMDQWAPGLKTFLQDFFTNSQFGKMAGSILALFGINVGRLWGEENDDAALERARPVIEEGFDKYYKSAAEELGSNATFAQIMGKTREEITSDLDNSKAFKMAMGILFKDGDEKTVERAVKAALSNAEKAGSPEAAKAAFSQTLIEAGQQYQNGQALDIEQLNILLDQAVEEVQQTAVQNPQFAPSGSAAAADADLVVKSGASSNGQSTALDASGQAYVRDNSAAAADAELIKVGDQRIELVFTPNNDEWIQGPTRYAHGRVDDIQSVLGDNAELLALSLSADMMKVDGKYTDMMTPNTNAVIEETLIRAQIHAVAEQGVEITPEILEGMDRKLSLTNLDVVTDYMRAQGVADTDIARFSANVTELGNDFLSTDPRDKMAGDKQEHTVWQQSHFGNQFKLDIAQWAPQAKVAPLDNVPADVDPRYQEYLDYNKDRPCDVPMFFVEDGKAYAAIIDQNGTKGNTADDEFKVIELNNYLNMKPHNLYSTKDQRALLDNYNWSNPTKEGLEAVINKVLCLESVALVIDAPKVQQQAQSGPTDKLEHTPFVINEPDLGGRRPEVYKELPKFRNEEWADFVAQGIGLGEHRGYNDQAGRDLTHVLDAYFEHQMGAPSGGLSNYMILDLDSFGLEHKDFDAIVAIRDGRDIDYRYVDYDKHDIIPIADQRGRGLADIKDTSFDPDSKMRRLDDFLDEINREGTGRRQGANQGYMHAEMLVPGGELPRRVNAFHGVYGLDAANNLDGGTPVYRRYIQAYSERASARQSYEQSVKYAESLRAAAEYETGMTPAQRAAIRNQADNVETGAYASASSRQNEFNNQSGCSEYVSNVQRLKDSDIYKDTRGVPLVDRAVKSYGTTGAKFLDMFGGLGKALGGGGLDALDNSVTPAEVRAAEECRARNEQASINIMQNMHDTGVAGDVMNDPAMDDTIGGPAYGTNSGARVGMGSVA